MNSKSIKTSDPQNLLLNFKDKIDLKRKSNYSALSNLSIHYTRKNIKQSYRNNNFKTSAPTWHEEFQLNDESYSISNIQVYFEYIIQKHGVKTVITLIGIYINKIEKKSRLKLKQGIISNF